MNRTEIHWMNGANSLPEQMVFIEALPGVGNVGKIIVDALIEEHESECLAWLMHPDFPPHSTMKDGLLHPPRIEIHQVLLPMGLPVIVLTGDSQPLTPTGQYELADKILKMLDKADAELLLILVGLQADVEEQSIHLVCSDIDTRDAFAERGVIASTTAPEAGMIGMAGLLAGMAPLRSVPAACAVAETLGSTVDVIAGQRLASWVEEKLGIALEISIDTTESTAERIRREIALDQTELDSLLNPSEPSPEFYV